jgi:hypothetical protein
VSPARARKPQAGTGIVRSRRHNVYMR